MAFQVILSTALIASTFFCVELGIGTFVLSGLLALLITWWAVGWQALRAAVANPVDALRTE